MGLDERIGQLRVWASEAWWCWRDPDYRNVSDLDWARLVRRLRKARRVGLVLGGGAVAGILTGIMVTWLSPVEVEEAEAVPVELLADYTRLFECKVTYVYDGDGPIHCADGRRIRLTAVSAREMTGECRPGHPCPDASPLSARTALRRLAMRQTLTCEATGMSYDRITAWCWREDGVELNCAMVDSGTALRWPKFDPRNHMCRRVLHPEGQSA